MRETGKASTVARGSSYHVDLVLAHIKRLTACKGGSLDFDLIRRRARPFCPWLQASFAKELFHLLVAILVGKVGKLSFSFLERRMSILHSEPAGPVVEGPILNASRKQPVDLSQLVNLTIIKKKQPRDCRF